MLAARIFQFLGIKRINRDDQYCQNSYLGCNTIERFVFQLTNFDLIHIYNSTVFIKGIENADIYYQKLRIRIFFMKCAFGKK